MPSRESLGEDYLWLYDDIIEYCKTEESSKMALFLMHEIGGTHMVCSNYVS